MGMPANVPSGQPELWSPFSSKDKGCKITLSNGGKTASVGNNVGSVTVRAGPWVSREGNATATIRVDGVNANGGSIMIGVLTKDYEAEQTSSGTVKTNTGWNGWMGANSHAWFYTSDGCFFHQAKRELKAVPHFSTCSKLTVTLSKGTITFSKDVCQVHSFILPKNCGPISLGVSLSTGWGGTFWQWFRGYGEGTQVTLL